jgi:uncharacterized membrane protein
MRLNNVRMELSFGRGRPMLGRFQIIRNKDRGAAGVRSRLRYGGAATTGDGSARLFENTVGKRVSQLTPTAELRSNPLRPPRKSAKSEGSVVNAAAPAPRARDSRLLLIIVLMLAAGLLWFVTRRLHYLTDYSPGSYSDYFWPRRAGLIPHLVGGIIAITVGVAQIWLGLTRRVHTLHRVLGKIYGVAVLIGSFSGFYLALTIPGHLPYSAGLFMLDVAWLRTTGMALYAIRTRRIEQHREWMLRSYTVTFAFVTFRLLADWLRGWVPVPEDPVADEIDTLAAWACWAVPLLLAEPLIQLRSMRLRARAAAD